MEKQTVVRKDGDTLVLENRVPVDVIQEMVEHVASSRIFDDLAEIVHRRLRDLNFKATVKGEEVEGKLSRLEDLGDGEVDLVGQLENTPDDLLFQDGMTTLLESFVECIISDYTENGVATITRDQAEEALGIQRSENWSDVARRAYENTIGKNKKLEV